MNQSIKKRSLATVTAVALLTAGVFYQTSASAESSMPFSGPDSVEYAQDLWSKLVAAGMTGPNAAITKTYKGVHPHGAVLDTNTSEVEINGHTGTVIVKRNFGGEGINEEKVSSDANTWLKAITVMYQREDGYDSDNQNWFWAKYLPDGSLDKNDKGMSLAGRVAKGKPVGCIACHAAAPGADYIFTN